VTAAAAAAADVSDLQEAVLTVTVPMGRSAVASATEQLRTIGLGSCVAIIIFAPAQHLAALAHCMLPSPNGWGGDAAKYVDTAVPALLKALHRAGARAPFTAVLVGGASMFPGLETGFVRDIAGDNLRSARAALHAANVPVHAEDVGGHVGRSVRVDSRRQRVTVHTIAAGDRCL